MPVQHRRNQRVPVDLQPKLMELLEGLSVSLDIPRTKLLRLLIIDGVKNILTASPEEQKTIINTLYSLESPVMLNYLHEIKDKVSVNPPIS